MNFWTLINKISSNCQNVVRLDIENCKNVVLKNEHCYVLLKVLNRIFLIPKSSNNLEIVRHMILKTVLILRLRINIQNHYKHILFKT